MGSQGSDAPIHGREIRNGEGSFVQSPGQAWDLSGNVSSRMACFPTYRYQVSGDLVSEDIEPEYLMIRCIW